MTGQKRAASKPIQSGSKRQAAPNEDPAIEFRPPLKPHPKLMIVLGIILAVWLIALIVMRQTTIRPAPNSPVNTLPSLSQ
jgi:hypothetical protein